MKKKLIWKIILLIGICPFVLPFVSGIYMTSTESWELIDWLIMYSFIYWPTYLVGFILIVISLNKLIK